MPYKPKTPCRHRGCPNVCEPGMYFCETHKDEQVQRDRERDARRASAYERGYDNKWRKFRAMYLRRNPLCRQCEKEGRLTPATVIDHITPHRGDQTLFWDIRNMQPLCKLCHDKKTGSGL